MLGVTKEYMPQQKLYGSQKINMAAYNCAAAKFFLKLAEEQPDGEFYFSMASLVFSAFTFEAFLNSVGAKLEKCWEQHGRKPPKEKLDVITEMLGLKPNNTARPYSSLRQLLKFRNTIAHGKDEQRNIAKKFNPTWTNLQMVKSLETEWQKYCRKANARKAFDDIRLVAEEICTKAGFPKFPDFPFGSTSHGMYSRSHKVKPNEQG